MREDLHRLFSLSTQVVSRPNLQETCVTVTIMAAATEKEVVQQVERIKQVDEDAHEVQASSVALAAALAARKPRPFSKNMLQLYAIMGVGYLVSTMNGYDGSLMGSINAMKQYQKTFGLDGAGSSTGVVFIVVNLGQIAAFPFCGLIADGFGRRACIFVGCLLAIVAALIQTFVQVKSAFIGGRFLLGFGTAIASAAGPTYTVELAHPAYRGFQAGMYNNLWWVGNILAGWVSYGSNLRLQNSWAWRLPVLLQAALPAVAMAWVFFLPESPRWLIAHDRREEALAIFAKYHADGDETAPIVELQYQEIIEQMRLYRDKNPWWDYRELFNTRAARYRIAMVIATSFFGQWSGNNVVSYFLPEMLKNAGITNSNKQLLITAINPIFSMIGAVYGASLLDRLGRRKMMLGGLLGGLFAYVLLTAFTAQSYVHSNLVYGVIVSIYIFGICFAWGWTPLQTLYAVECLENRTRAKGSGVNFLFLNIAMVVNTYGISVGISKIEWRLYLVYIIWICIEILIIYFFFVETAGKTLEELAEVFNAPNPRNASLKRAKVTITSSGVVTNVDDA